jgi:hypothetical protein
MWGWCLVADRRQRVRYELSAQSLQGKAMLEDQGRVGRTPSRSLSSCLEKLYRQWFPMM